MNYIVREETGRIIDVLDNKKEFLEFTRTYINNFNADMIKSGEEDNVIMAKINSVGDCIDLLYDFSISVDLR